MSNRSVLMDDTSMGFCRTATPGAQRKPIVNVNDREPWLTKPVGTEFAALKSSGQGISHDPPRPSPGSKDRNTQMQHKTTEAVFQYFNGLRGDRTAPLRSEIDPAALKSVLPDLFILEKGRDGIVRFRLAGTRMCLILGREMRDRAFTDIWDTTVQHRMRLAADAVIANQSALEIAVIAVDDEGNTISLEMLMLPLFSRVDQCDRIFGSLVSLESVPAVEGYMRYLEPADLVFVPTETSRPLAASPAPRSVTTASLRQFANRAGHLRVYEGGRRD